MTSELESVKSDLEPLDGRPAGPVDETPDHVHHMTNDLTAFLEAVVEAGNHHG